MDLSAIRAQTISTPFLDHTNQPALSITYPVLKDLQKKYALQRQQRPGSLETYLNYPCFQVYIPRPHASKMDISHEQTEVEGTILEFIADLERHHFFQAFQGIRLEIHYGRAEFANYVRSGGVSRRVAERICNHALQECEERNTSECLRAEVAKFLNSNLRHQYLKNGEQRASIAQLREMSHGLNQLVSNICDLGALNSPDIARLNEERRSYHVLAAQPQNSISNEHRSLMTNSDLDLDTIRKQCHSVTRTIEGFLRLELKKVRIPITPTSFYCPGPDEQPWHHVVIVLHSERLHEDGIHIIKFAQDLPVGTKLELDTNLFMAGELDYKISSASFGKGARANRSTPYFGVILAGYLNALGLTKPSFLEERTKSRFDNNADVGAGAQLTEMKQEVEEPNGDLNSIPDHNEDGDVVMDADYPTTGQHEQNEEANEECAEMENKRSM